MKKKRKLSPITFFNSRVTATISIALVLFLLGLIILLSLFTANFSNYLKETLSFDIVLQDNTSKEHILKLQKALNEAPFTKSTKYVSKEEAIRQLAVELGQNPEDFLGFNPLPDLINVHLNSQYANLDSLKTIEARVLTLSGKIKETEYREDFVQMLNENITHIGLILLIIAVVLLFISFALINNTIRLIVYSKRFIIHTMQLVGAKKGFIRKPFVTANILCGIVAALIANGLLYWLIYYAQTTLPDIDLLLTGYSLWIVFGSVLLLGILISGVATYFAVNKYISADIDELYKM
ncbi:MAG: permease-like cell division protein FtsX [Candidatus Symbiothrix sp.]|jgi:cell division transport system permease protein|nr:permease-like cell division protein FtsX [Candidatus Symbiothrix sp.]